MIWKARAEIAEAEIKNLTEIMRELRTEISSLNTDKAALLHVHYQNSVLIKEIADLQAQYDQMVTPFFIYI